jgi:hypothetical protein
MATTLAGEITKVRNLLDETSSSNTRFHETNFIPFALNDGRRAFARILPQEMLPGLVTTQDLTLASGYVAFHATFFRHYIGGRQLVDGVIAHEIPPEERWRLRFLSSNDLVKGDAEDKYYFFEKSGVLVYPTTAITFTHQFIKTPTDLGVSDNLELPDDVDNYVVEYAFERCMGTQRGDTELASYIAKKRGIYLKELKP